MSSGTATTASRTLTLRDGRSLGYAEYGDPHGKPVFLCHGTPGCRLQVHPNESIVTALGVRLIVADRPGYGLSTFQPRRRLLDWPDDVAQLADALGIERFAVIGWSGGGSHTAACVYKMPQRLTRACLIAAAAPLDIPRATQGMAVINRSAAIIGRYVPFFVQRALSTWEARGRRHYPEKLFDQLMPQLPAVDRAALTQTAFRRMLDASVAEAYRQGGRGHAWESRLFAQPWGFRLQDIAVEVHLWHGEEDTLVPPGLGRYLAGAIPGCVATFLPGEGHFTVYEKCWRDILSAAVA